MSYGVNGKAGKVDGVGSVRVRGIVLLQPAADEDIFIP